MQIIDIPLSDLRPNADNTRTKAELKRDHPKMIELTQSIAQGEVLQPIQVRQQPGKDGYEIVFGERRFHASRYAGKKTIPAFIKECTDEELLTQILTENFQRENPDPLAEARALCKFVERGYDLTRAAAHFGQNLSWALKRAKLAELSPTWVTAYEEGNLGLWGIEHLILIARYDREVQERLFEDLRHQIGYERSTKRLIEVLAKQMRDLTRVPWDLDDASLVPEAGACNACPKRSSCQKLIFDDLPTKPKGKESDYCTDHQCFAQKQEAAYQVRLVELRTRNPDLREAFVKRYQGDDGVLGTGDYETCLKSDQGAMQVVARDGDSPGRIFYVRGRKEVRNGKVVPGKVPGEPTATSLDEKRAQLAKRRGIWCCRALLEIVSTIPTTIPVAERPAKDDDEYLPIVILGGNTGIAGDDAVDDDDTTNEDLEHLADVDDEPETRNEGTDEDAPASERLTALVGALPSLNQQVLWAYGMGVRSQAYMHYHSIVASPRTLIGAFTGKQATLADHLWCAVKPSMVEHLKRVIAMKLLRDEWVQFIAHATGVDLTVVQERAEVAIPEPKSWRSQHPEAYHEDASEPMPSPKSSRGARRGRRRTTTTRRRKAG